MSLNFNGALQDANFLKKKGTLAYGFWAAPDFGAGRGWPHVPAVF
jgi:hypothetical protein